MTEYAQRVIKEVEESTEAWENIFEDFSEEGLYALLRETIDAVEVISEAPGSGEDKKQIVLEVWDYYNKRFKLVDQLDKLIDLKKILKVPLIGRLAEQWDDDVIEWVIERFLIPNTVSLFNATVWRNAND